MISSELIQKYNVAGPRYTSYPTVPYWEETPSSEQWIESIRTGLVENEGQGIGSGIYIHIPFCESLCTYCGCNTRITRNHAVGTPYVDTVLQEWKIYLEKLGRTQGPKIRLSELHLGGGTPTFLSVAELEKLVSGILEHCEVVNGAEFSIEVDPRVTQRDQLEMLAKYGFNRLSLGVQDFDYKVQDIVHRIQSEAQVRKITEMGRELGYRSINYDLIYGLPLQTLESIQMTIEAIKRLRPDRIAFYSYAHVPWIKPSQRRFTEADLPSGELKRKIYELGRTMLENVGYKEIGMDHFSLETDSLWKATLNKTLHRNFMGYMPRMVAPLIGLGVSAIGDSWRVFAQNEKLVETYQSRVQNGELPIHRGHVLTDEDLVIRRHVLNLMCRFETSWSEPKLQDPHLDQIHQRLAEFEKDGLVELRPQGCKILEPGRPFLRNICMAFDVRLSRKAPDTQLFSKTI